VLSRVALGSLVGSGDTGMMIGSSVSLIVSLTGSGLSGVSGITSLIGSDVAMQPPLKFVFKIIDSRKKSSIKYTINR